MVQGLPGQEGLNVRGQGPSGSRAKIFAGYVAPLVQDDELWDKPDSVVVLGPAMGHRDSGGVDDGNIGQV